MADDDFGTTSKKIKRKHKKKRTEGTNLDFDAEWDSIPSKPKPAPIIEAPKELQVSKSDMTHQSSRQSSTQSPDEKKSKKKSISSRKKEPTKKKSSPEKKTKTKPKDGTSGTGKVSDIYSADKTTHVIEYGIKHDAIRQSRADTKAIKEKIRLKRLEQKRKEEEAKQKHKEFLERQKKQKAELKKKNAKIKNASGKNLHNETKKEAQKEPKKDDLDFSINKTPRRKSKLGGNIVPKSPSNKPKSPGIKVPKMGKQRSFKKDKTETKKDQPKKPKKRLSKLKDNNKMEPLINIKELQVLKEENIDLKRQLKKMEFVQRKYDNLKNENSLFKEQILILNEENDMLKKENDELTEKMQENIKNNKENISNNKNDRFDENDVHNTYDSNDEQKIDAKLLNGTADNVSGSESDKNKKENSDSESDSSDGNNSLANNDGSVSDNENNNAGGSGTSGSSSESAEWEEWEADTICDWIVALDSKYKKYEKILRKKLAEEEMHGSLLGDLNGNDLDRFGIKSMKHKKNIIAELGKLTKKNGSDDSDSSD